MSKVKIKKPYAPRERCVTELDPVGLTEQHHKDKCDINLIVERATRTGVVPGNPAQPQYMDVPGLTYHQALEIVRKSQDSFQSLPAAVRAEFENDPGRLLAAVDAADSNPDIKQKLQSLGVLRPDAPPQQDKPAEPAKASTPQESPQEPA